MADGSGLGEGLFEEILGEIFSTMVPLSLERIPNEAEVSPFKGVTTFISITGESRRYVLIVQGSERLACRIYGAMLGESVEAWSRDVADSFGELANMAAGAFKTAIAVDGLALSIPTVIRGDAYDWSAPGVKVTHEERFKVDGEPLAVRVGESVE